MHVKIIELTENDTYYSIYLPIKKNFGYGLDSEKKSIVLSIDDDYRVIKPDDNCTVWLENDKGGTITKIVGQMEVKPKEVVVSGGEGADLDCCCLMGEDINPKCKVHNK